MFGLGYFAQVRDFIKYFIFSAIAVSPAFVLTFTELSPILVLISGAAIACAIYLFLLRNDPNLKELFSLLKKKK